jgi:hypothetical protein
MTDDELEVWRRQWQAQPSVTLELIRRVERETVYLRHERLGLLAPGAVGVGTIILAVVTRQAVAILLAVGTWLFIGIGAWFMANNRRGVWAPAAETTDAYVELSIERCRRTLKYYRFNRVLAVFLTAFVLVADYQLLKGLGALETTGSSWTVAGAFLLSIAMVVLAMSAEDKKRKKTETELAYLLNLQRQIRDEDR